MNTQPKAVVVANRSYYVAATTLNLREEPAADAAVVRVLEQNDVVRVQELVDGTWAKVVATTYVSGEGFKDFEGYLSRNYLSNEKAH